MKSDHVPIILAIAGFGQDEVLFWNEVSKYLSQKNFQLYMLRYGWKDTLEKPIFPFTDLSRIYGLELLLKDFGCDFNHVEIVWKIMSLLLKPNFIFLWNGMHYVWKEWYQIIAKSNLPMCVAEKAGFKHVYQFESKGINYLSDLLREDFLKENGYFQNAESKKKCNLIDFSNYFLQKKESNKIQPYSMPLDIVKTSMGIKPQDKVITYFGVWDEASGLKNTEYFDKNSFFSSKEAARKLIDAVLNSDCHIILKQHPDDCASPWDDLLINNKIHLANEINSFDLIEISDIVASIASSLLYTATLYPKPILLMGTISQLSNKNFCFELHLNDSNEYAKYLVSAALNNQNPGYRLNAKDRFLNFYLDKFCCTANQDLIDFGVQSITDKINKIIEKIELRETIEPIISIQESSELINIILNNNLCEIFQNQIDLKKSYDSISKSYDSISKSYDSIYELLIRAKHTPLGAFLKKINITGTKALNRLLNY